MDYSAASGKEFVIPRAKLVFTCPWYIIRIIYRTKLLRWFTDIRNYSPTLQSKWRELRAGFIVPESSMRIDARTDVDASERYARRFCHGERLGACAYGSEIGPEFPLENTPFENATRRRRGRNSKQRVQDLSCFTVRRYKWPVISNGPHKSEGVDVILISATNVTDAINTFRARARLSLFEWGQKYHPRSNVCRAAANGIYGGCGGKRILNRKQKKRKENRTFVRRARVWLSLRYERDHFVTSEINGFPCASTASGSRSLHPFVDTKEWKYP